MALTIEQHEWASAEQRTPVSQPTFEAHDVWVASYLHLNGIPFIRCYRNEWGRTRWVFSDRERAYHLYLAWRSGDAQRTLVPGTALVAAYRQMCAVSKEANSIYRGGDNEQRAESN